MKNSIVNTEAEHRAKPVPGGLGAGTKLLMADGRSKRAEDIHVGDRLLGSDGCARNVLSKEKGYAVLYRINPYKGTPFIVSENQKLTLVGTNESSSLRFGHGGETVDISVDDWLKWSGHRMNAHKLIRSGAVKDFPDVIPQGRYPIDPYFLGLLLGDGCICETISITTMDKEVVQEIYRMAGENHMNVRVVPAGLARTYFLVRNTTTNGVNCLAKALKELHLFGCSSRNKFIPDEYLYSDIDTRLQLIAALIDTDGYYGTNVYDYISGSERLANDLAFLCRSVGLAAYVKECQRSCQNGYTGTFYRVSISGHCDRIPCRVERKKAAPRRQKKNVLHTGLTALPAGFDMSYGFTVDRDHRYLLSDFTVMHD